MIGGENPRNICLVASRMSSDTYAILVQLGSYKDLDAVQSRAELLILEFDLKRKISQRREKDDEEGASRLQRKCAAIEYLKSEFSAIRILKHTLKEKCGEMLRSSQQNDTSWQIHHKEAKQVRAQMKMEEDAMAEWLKCSEFPHLQKLKTEIAVVNISLESATRENGTPGGSGIPSPLCLRIEQKILRSKIRREEKKAERSGILTTRRGIESKLVELKNALEQAKGQLMFEKVKGIDLQIQLLEELRVVKPSTAELKSWSSVLRNELLDATSRCDWDLVKILHCWFQETKRNEYRETRTWIKKESLHRQEGRSISIQKLFEPRGCSPREKLGTRKRGIFFQDPLAIKRASRRQRVGKRRLLCSVERRKRHFHLLDRLVSTARKVTLNECENQENYIHQSQEHYR
jgi:hypothetical protein